MLYHAAQGFREAYPPGLSPQLLRMTLNSLLPDLGYMVCPSDTYIISSNGVLNSYMSQKIVPASSDRMLEKSLTNHSDMIIYDLEDSVPPSQQDKDTARSRLVDFLKVIRTCTSTHSTSHDLTEQI